MTELVRYKSAPFGGPFSIFTTFQTSVVAMGVWVPFDIVKQASVEVVGGGTFSVSIYGTNTDPPVNQATLTLSGTLTTGNVIGLNFTGAPTGQQAVPPFTVSYTVQSTDTTTTILAASLAAAINANSNCQTLGILATSSAAVITLSWPSVAPGNAPAEFQQPSSPPAANVVQVSYTQGSNSEAIAVAYVTPVGTLLGSAITSAGLTQLTSTLLPVRWIRVSVTSLTAPIAVNIQGVA
jgi:hypothetical protein